MKRLKSSRSYKALTPDQVPDLWLLDSQYLLDQLAGLRGLMLRVPVSLATYLPVNNAVDAIWRLEEQLRFMLQIQREAQRKFGEKHDEQQKKGLSAGHAESGGKAAVGANTVRFGGKAKRAS